MKTKIKHLLLLFIPFTSFLSFSQGNGTIYTRSDTLTDVQVAERKEKTNYKQVTFSVNNVARTLASSEVIAYWKGKNFLRSYPLEDRSFAFAKILLQGPCVMGKIVTELGDIKFVFKHKDEELFKVLSDQDEAIPFFQNLLPSFDDFIKGYTRQITFDQRSLGELVSSYNQFIDPAKYKFTSLKHQRSFKLGAFLSAEKSNVVVNKEKFLTGTGVQYGLFANHVMSPKIAAHFRVGISSLRESIEPKSIALNSFRMESWFPLTLNNSRKVNVALAPGLHIGFNSNSSIAGHGSLSGSFLDERRIQGLSSGTSLNLMFGFETARRTAGFFLGLQSTSFDHKIDSLSPTFSASEGLKGRVKAFRFGFNYGF